MLSLVLDWLRNRRDEQAKTAVRSAAAEYAISLARDAFAKAYPERQALADWLYVDAVEEGHIVTLLSPVEKPPRRSWWEVRATGAVTELSYEEAAGRIAMPAWR